MTLDPTSAAMAASLQVMKENLAKALGHVADAIYYINQGEKNAAIGSMPGTGELLEETLALFISTRALHRAGRAP